MQTSQKGMDPENKGCLLFLAFLVFVIGVLGLTIVLTGNLEVFLR